jgi:tRNA (guanine37-N1)-methyltransferase
MRFSVLTLFPEIIDNYMRSSITGRALQNNLFELNLIQIRNFAVNKYGKVDDYLFGGGTGMLMMAEPVFQAWQYSASAFGKPERTIYLSPKGKTFTQKKAVELSTIEHTTFICGHYEGIDQRVLDQVVDEELSIGDYVITGGEIAACVVMDAVSRLIPGVLPDNSAYLEESHMSGFLEQPHYTRPAKWQEKNVPEVLLSGHQAKINEWQHLMSIRETIRKRPELLKETEISLEDWQKLITLDF